MAALLAESRHILKTHILLRLLCSVYHTSLGLSSWRDERGHGGCRTSEYKIGHLTCESFKHQKFHSAHIVFKVFSSRMEILSQIPCFAGIVPASFFFWPSLNLRQSIRSPSFGCFAFFNFIFCVRFLVLCCKKGLLSPKLAAIPLPLPCLRKNISRKCNFPLAILHFSWYAMGDLLERK